MISPEQDIPQLGRMKPSDINAEQSVLACMIMDKDAISTVSSILRREDFSNKAYGQVFDAMVEMDLAGKPVDPILLSAVLKEKGLPQEISELGFLNKLVADLMSPAFAENYAKLVAEKSTLRNIINVCEDLAKRCYLGEEKAEDILKITEKSIFDLLQRKGADTFVPIREIVMDTMKEIEVAARNKSAITGLATGFRELDARLAGLQKSDLILIAARPSMGKTAFALNIAQHIAFNLKKTVAIFSLEMSRNQLVKRLFALGSHVDSQNLRTGQLNEMEWEALIEAAGVVGRSSLIIEDKPGINPAELLSKCRRYKVEYDLSLIIIDYLQLMSGSGNRKGENRQNEISEISRALKGIARELDVPVIALSQLSRNVEQRGGDKRPMLSDLRESGAIEQDADVVMFIFREEVYVKDTENKGIAEINVAKQRNGPIGKVELAWLADYTKFANLEYDRNQNQDQLDE